MTEKEKDKERLTRAEWKAKYGSDTQYYTHTLNKVDITTGKKVRDLIESAAKKHGIDASFLASTLFSEGLDRYDMFDEKDNPFSKDDYNDFPVSGMKYLGLDTIGNRKEELIKKGLVDRNEYAKRTLESFTKNEKDQDVISVDAKDLEYGIDLVGAFIKNENDNLDSYLKKNNIDVTPIQKTFFRNVAYNAGLGNAQKMASSYNDKGFLKDDSFLDERPNDSWKDVYKHAHKRTTAGMGLSDNAGFTKSKSDPNRYQKQIKKEVAPLSAMETKGLMPAEIKALEKSREKEAAIATVNQKGLLQGNNANFSSAKIEKAPNKIRSKTSSMKPITPKSVITPEVEERIIANLQIGIPAVESAKDGYQAINRDNKDPAMQALGKYQFVPKYWWKDINKFAEKNGFNIETYQDFLNTPSLQDSYFRHYVKNEILPQAQAALAKGNPENISLEEATMFYHFQAPKTAEKAIVEGKSAYRKETKKGVNGATVNNISMEGYKEKYNEAISSAGLEIVPNLDIMDPKVKSKIANDYFSEVDAVLYDAKDLSEKEKNQRISEIQSKYKANGYLDVVNDQIEVRNEEAKKDHKPISDQDKKTLTTMLNYAREANYSYEKKDGTNSVSKTGSIKFENPKERQAFKDFADQNGIKYQELSGFNFNIKNLRDVFKDKYKETTGFEADTKIAEAEFDKAEGEVNSIAGSLGLTTRKKGKLVFDDTVEKRINNAGQLSLVQKIDPLLVPDLPKKEEEKKSETSKTETKGSEAKADPNDTTTAKAIAEENPEINSADSFFSNERGLMNASKKSFDKGGYDKNDFKKDLPIDAFTGLAIGLIGQQQARDAEIPLRTEEVSGMIDMYVAELAKRSRNGLPPEVEAAMKNQFAESFQAGIRANVNASGGNRATVLGNQGALSVAMNKGMVMAQMEDYKAKERAFQQYGQAIQYIDAVDRNREIANTTLKQQQGFMQQQEGKNLAAAGFQKLTDEIAYQRDNGPGSVNHMARSGMMQRIFGFDPEMKDDGTGKAGTRSAWEKQKSVVEEDAKKVEQYEEKYYSLDPEQRKSVGKVYENNPNSKALYGEIDKLHRMSNPYTSNQVAEKPNTDWMANDFGTGLNPDGTPAPPNDPVRGVEAEMASVVPKTTLSSDPQKPGMMPHASPGLLGGAFDSAMGAGINTIGAAFSKSPIENNQPATISLSQHDIVSAEGTTESPMPELNAYSNYMNNQ